MATTLIYFEANFKQSVKKKYAEHPARNSKAKRYYHTLSTILRDFISQEFKKAHPQSYKAIEDSNYRGFSYKSLDRALRENKPDGGSELLREVLGYFTFGKEWPKKKGTFTWEPVIKSTSSLKGRGSVGRMEIEGGSIINTIKDFIARGYYNEARESFEKGWRVNKSWGLLLLRLEIAERDGHPEKGLKYYSEYRDLEPNNELDAKYKTRLTYYLGRLHTQLGEYKEAIVHHTDNTSEHNDYYCILSNFELATIYFRIEDFEHAYKELDKLIKSEYFEKLKDSVLIKIHALHFFATLKTIREIHSRKFFNVEKVGVTLDAKGAHECNNRTEQLIESLKSKSKKEYYERKAWFHCVRAFAFESEANIEMAHEDYKAALKNITHVKKHLSSFLHISLYYAGFLRRSQNNQEALVICEGLFKLIKGEAINKDEGRIYEEMAYNYEAMNNIRHAKTCYTKFIKHYIHNSPRQLKPEWPLWKRIKKISVHYKLKIDW